MNSATLQSGAGGNWPGLEEKIQMRRPALPWMSFSWLHYVMTSWESFKFAGKLCSSNLQPLLFLCGAILYQI